MPKEYTDCKKAVMESGKSEKDAARICAIQYYKKHGKTPQQAAGDSKASFTALDLETFDVLDTWASIMRDSESAVWSTAYVNNLPDSAFAYIEPGGKKDSEGKTEPRSKRHLPYKDANGKVDPAHVQNAISRAPQVKGISPEKAKAIQAKLRKLLGNAK